MLFDLILPEVLFLAHPPIHYQAQKVLPIQNHDFVVITGASGIGKSTLFRSLVGLNNSIECTYKDHCNDAIFKGSDLKNSSFKIAYLQQDSHFISDTILSNIRLGQDSISIDDIKHILLSLKLPCNDLNVDEFLCQQIGENSSISLSGGELKRLSLARALVLRPDILFCDEITSGLDKTTEIEILSLIQKYAKITFIVSHSSEVISLATKSIKLEH